MDLKLGNQGMTEMQNVEVTGQLTDGLSCPVLLVISQHILGVKELKLTLNMQSKEVLMQVGEAINRQKKKQVRPTKDQAETLFVVQ